MSGFRCFIILYIQAQAWISRTHSEIWQRSHRASIDNKGWRCIIDDHFLEHCDMCSVLKLFVHLYIHIQTCIAHLHTSYLWLYDKKVLFDLAYDTGDT